MPHHDCVQFSVCLWGASMTTAELLKKNTFHLWTPLKSVKDSIQPIITCSIQSKKNQWGGSVSGRAEEWKMHMWWRSERKRGAGLWRALKKSNLKIFNRESMNLLENRLRWWNQGVSEMLSPTEFWPGWSLWRGLWGRELNYNCRGVVFEMLHPPSLRCQVFSIERTEETELKFCLFPWRCCHKNGSTERQEWAVLLYFKDV